MGDPWTGPPVWNVQAAVGLRRGIAPGNAPSLFGPRNGATSEPGAAPECASKDEARIPAAKASRLFEFMASRTRETGRRVAPGGRCRLVAPGGATATPPPWNRMFRREPPAPRVVEGDRGPLRPARAHRAALGEGGGPAGPPPRAQVARERLRAAGGAGRLVGEPHGDRFPIGRPAGRSDGPALFPAEPGTPAFAPPPRRGRPRRRRRYPGAPRGRPP